MTEYKVIINMDTKEVCSVEMFVRNVNKELKYESSGYTVGKVFEEPWNTENPPEFSEPGSERQEKDVLENIIQHIDRIRDYIELNAKNDEILTKRIVTLEEVRNNQVQINDTFTEAYIRTTRMIGEIDKRVCYIENLLKAEELKGTKLYTLQEFDTIIKELNRQKKLLEGHLGIDPKKKRGRGRPRKFPLDPDITPLQNPGKQPGKKSKRGRPSKNGK